MRREHAGDGQVVVERAARLEPPASRLRRARHRARGWVRYRFKGWAPWLGYLYLALALAYAIDEAVVPGIVGLALGVPVTWTCGLWVVPRSEDAYILAVSNTLRDSGVEIEQAQRRHSVESAELAAAVLDSLPASLQPELRQRLNDALHRKATSAVLTQDALFTRLVSAHKQRVALRATLAQIEIKEDDVSEVTATVRTFLGERNAADRMYMDAVRQEQMRLTKIVPPRHCVDSTICSSNSVTGTSTLLLPITWRLRMSKWTRYSRLPKECVISGKRDRTIVARWQTGCGNLSAALIDVASSANLLATHRLRLRH